MSAYTEAVIHLAGVYPDLANEITTKTFEDGKRIHSFGSVGDLNAYVLIGNHAPVSEISEWFKALSWDYRTGGLSVLSDMGFGSHVSVIEGKIVERTWDDY